MNPNLLCGECAKSFHQVYSVYISVRVRVYKVSVRVRAKERN